MKTLDETYREINELCRRYFCEDTPEVKAMALSFNADVTPEARRIHRESIIIDACTFGLENYNWHLEEGGVTALNCTVPDVADRAGQAVHKIINYYSDANADPRLIVAQTADDIVRAKQEGKVASIIGAQNCDFLFHNDLEASVALFHRMGLRVLGIGYNNSSFAADGCYTGTNAGLTKEGKALVQYMDKYGITLDLSHCGYKSAEEAIELTESIPVFTHSNPRALYEHARNIPDHLIKKCAAKGGVIGACAYRAIMWDGEHFPTIDHFVDVIKYLADLVGADHVGIGLDSNAQPGSYDRRQNKLFSQILRDQGETTNMAYRSYLAGRGYRGYCVDGIANLSNFPNIVEHMLKHGFQEEDIKKIIGGNWLRIFRQTWK